MKNNQEPATETKTNNCGAEKTEKGTSSDNKMQKSKQHKKFLAPEIRREIHQKLQTLFPKTFSMKAPLPLKIGIHEEIINHPGFDESMIKLRQLLFIHCQSIPYLKSAIELKKRFDLTGTAVDDIPDDVIDNLQKVLDVKLKNLNNKKKKNQQGKNT